LHVAKADLPILIAGGGIGGLCAALALSQRGFAVHVLEAAPEFMEVGAGLQIGPNAGRILANWGLADALKRHARRPERLLLKDAVTGQTLAAIPLGDTAEARYGAPYLVTTRYSLHRLLLEAAQRAGNVTFSRGLRVADWSASDDGVVLRGSGRNTPIEGRALIAADGVHSALREKICPGARARPSGRTAFRALGPLSQSGAEDNAVCVWMAPGAHLVHYRTGEGEELNMVAILRDGDVPETHGPTVEASQLQAGFQKCCFELQLLLASAPHWTRWPLLTMPPLARWSRGPAVLLGDAAHPLQPFLASGAVMAIEDAAVLAQEFGRTPEQPKAAFQRYEDRRRPRLMQTQAAVTRAGEIYHMDGARRQARNFALGVLPQRMLLARNDWLYGYRI
jgi:salicylate hydroxylase